MREQESRRGSPLLVIVSGAPGSGKTILARRLGPALGLPVLTKDDLKETLYDTVGVSSQATSQRLGWAAFALLHRVAEQLLAAGVSTLLEANYQRGMETSLAPLLLLAPAVLLHCGGDAETIVRRYRERAERGERHVDHHDLDALPRLRQQLATDVYEPLNLNIPVLRVDATTPAEDVPDVAAIAAFVSGQMAACEWSAGFNGKGGVCGG